jgi:hypothetical protein
MINRQWYRLTQVYLERLRRPLTLMLCTLLPVCLLFARKHGYQPQELVANFTLVATLIPFGVGGVIMRSKADGTLAFIAGLPVSRHDHALSWLAVVVLLSLPLALAVMAMGSLSSLHLRGALLVLSGVSATMLIASVVMTVNAFQLSVRPTMAGVYFVSAMGVITMLIAALGALFDISAAQLLSLVRSEFFFVGLSVLVWIVAGTAFWWSWQRIGHFMTSYVGEPPKA